MQTASRASEYAGCLLRTTWARDRESQLDYIAPKTSSIDGDPMLTSGGKEHRSGARMNVNPLPVNASGFHHPAEILLAASPAGALMPAAVNRVPVGHVVTRRSVFSFEIYGYVTAYTIRPLACRARRNTREFPQ